jgi:hypothetical protein
MKNATAVRTPVARVGLPARYAQIATPAGSNSRTMSSGDDVKPAPGPPATLGARTPAMPRMVAVAPRLTRSFESVFTTGWLTVPTVASQTGKVLVNVRTLKYYLTCVSRHVKRHSCT